MGEAQTYVFFDCEATELTGSRITEISFVAVNKDEYVKYADDLKKILMTNEEKKKISSAINKYPRVMNKLTLAVNPMKQISLFVEDLTGLNNYNLERQAKFRDGPAQTITSFLGGLEDPVCLVAHNGVRFDFPLLNKEMEKANVGLPENILCCDSWAFFRKYYANIHAKQQSDSDVENLADPDVPESISALNTPKKVSTASQDTALKNTPKKNATLTEALQDSVLNSPNGNMSNNSMLSNSSQFLNTPIKSPNDKEDEVKTPDNRLVPPMTPPTSAKKRILELPACTPGKIAKVEGDGGIFSTDAYFRGLQIMPPSYSLPNLHKHLFGMKPDESHGAEVDSLVLLKTLAVTGSSFTEYMKIEACLLRDIQPRL